MADIHYARGVIPHTDDLLKELIEGHEYRLIGIAVDLVKLQKHGVQEVYVMLVDCTASVPLAFRGPIQYGIPVHFEKRGGRIREKRN